MKKSRFLTLLILSILLLVPLSVQANNGCNINILHNCISVDNVRAHQAAFQAIANTNGGTRVAYSSGYQASVDYIIQQLEAAGGYNIATQPFDYLEYFLTGGELEQIQPAQITYTLFDGLSGDFFPMDFSPDKEVTGTVTAVDIQPGLGNASTSGCEASDFAGFPAGNIALLQRGLCTFQIKAENAAAAGAVGAIIMNQGNTTAADRNGVLVGTLSAAYDVFDGIPVVGTSYDQGIEWMNTAGLQMRLSVSAFAEIYSSQNVFAESISGNANSVVMLGAHLDSVAEGPGINDNGSGSGAILEAAIQIAGEPVFNKLRFAWWGAEEAGLVGSDFYVYTLPAAERNKIKMYLNFDMIGSPNYFLGVYDGDGSAFGLAGPEGSAQIEHFFTTYFPNQFLETTAPTQISFRSDYAAFFDFGIPFGGLFTGAEGIKSPEDVALWGGVAGQQYDPCYHAACDTFANVSIEALDMNTRAIAAAITYFSSNRSIAGNHRQRRNYHAQRAAIEAAESLPSR